MRSLISPKYLSRDKGKISETCCSFTFDKVSWNSTLP
jgi:hypothetical protein